MHPGAGPRQPQVVVLFGATGDLAKRKLLPGLFHLASHGLLPGYRIIGVSLETISPDEFRDLVRAAMDEFSTRPFGEDEWRVFAQALDYVPTDAGPTALADAVPGRKPN